MKYLAIYLITLLLFLFSFQNANAKLNNQDLEYFGADHTEAEFSIVGQLRIHLANQPTKDQLDTVIRAQMRYMLGLMRSREKTAAALYPKWSFTTLETTKISEGVWSAKYLLKSKGVFATGTQEYTFTIPHRPLEIFKKSEGKCMEKESEDSNFWYHWEPLKPGCPLQEGVDYFTYTAALTPIANTTETYPEYEKLVDNNKTIKATMFFGFENYDFPKWTPDGGQDWGIIGYNRQREFLKNLGFTETVWAQEQVENIYKAKDGFVPYVIEMTLNGDNANLRYRLVLADTGYSHTSTAFHAFLKEALANESVVFYNGHSGIGQNLDLASIEKLRGTKLNFNPNYQIIFLGSCVPYSYYTEIFFNKKKNSADPKGTLNLDLLSYGKESVFANEEDYALTRAIVKWAQKGKKESYQDIIRASPNYFIGVSGDEDNPTSK
ncbi:hypothetical protein K2P97_12605 [bacterium]|nr:hypothetical protein [bacterium]